MSPKVTDRGTSIRWILRISVFLLGVAIVVGLWLFVISAEPKPILKVKLKRYGKTSEGLPVAWLLITNVSSARVSFLGDRNPVPTAFCEYHQALPTGKTNWIYQPISTSGGWSVRTNEEIAVRIFLPTNGVPVHAQLFIGRPTPARDLKWVRSLRMWFYRQGWASPIIKIPVPGELLHTNFPARIQY